MNRGLILIVTFFCIAIPVYAAPDSKDMQKAGTLNESAVQKIKTGDLDGAELDLLSALEYSNQNPRLRKNLGVVYYEKGAKALKAPNFYDAQRYFRSALDIEPGNKTYSKAFASALSLEAGVKAKGGRNEEALGLYERAMATDSASAEAALQAAYYSWKVQKLDKARDYLDRAKKLDPANKNIESMEEKLKKSSPEKNFEKETSEHFILSAEAGTMQKGSARLLYDLEKIYEEVGYVLNYFPQSKIPVVFYAEKEFHRHWKLPARVSGYYDGKLRIPYPGTQTSLEATKTVIKHELTHAFVSTMTQKNIPQWINEGLAQWVEGRKLDPKSRDALVTYQLSGRVFDVMHLDEALKSQKNPYNNTEMTLAYMKSLSVVEYLIEQNGVWSVVQFIKDHDSVMPEGALFKKHFKSTPSQVEERWIDWLGQKRK